MNTKEQNSAEVSIYTALAIAQDASDHIDHGASYAHKVSVILAAIEKSNSNMICPRCGHKDFYFERRVSAQPQRSETPQEEIARTGYLDGDHSAASIEPQEWTPDKVMRMGVDDAAIAYNIADAHNAALSASFNRGRLEGVFMSPNEDEANYVRKLEKELSAERERRKTLVEALEKVSRIIGSLDYPTAKDLALAQKIIESALASAKDVMDYDTGLI